MHEDVLDCRSVRLTGASHWVYLQRGCCDTKQSCLFSRTRPRAILHHPSMSQAQRRPLIFKKRSLATKLSLRRRNQQLLAKSNSPCSASSVSEEERNPVDMSQSPGVPELFTRRPVCRDKVRTQTCEDEDRVVASCLPFLNGRAFLRYGPDFLTVSGVPHLLRDRHKLFLEDSLEAYPPPFKSMDASRPWMLYWNLTALPLIGEDSSPYRRR